MNRDEIKDKNVEIKENELDKISVKKEWKTYVSSSSVRLGLKDFNGRFDQTVTEGTRYEVMLEGA